MPVRVEVVENEVDLRSVRNAFGQALHEPREDRSRSIRREQALDLPRGDIEPGREAEGPMTNVPVLDALRDTGNHPKVRVLALPGLDARLLVHAERGDALLGAPGRLPVHAGDVPGLRLEVRAVLRSQYWTWWGLRSAS